MAKGVDRARVARHAARVDGIFDDQLTVHPFVRWRQTAAAEALLAEDRDALISAVITAGALRIETDADDIERIYFLDGEGVADEVVRRKLTVDPADAALMLTLAAHERAWYYEIRIALHLAQRALADHPGHPDVIEALEAMRDRLETDALHVSGFFMQKVRPWVARLLAEQAPGGLLDLSFIDARCAWGRAAALAISHAAEAHDGAGPFVLHLASPRGTRASRQWWDDTEEWMRTAWARDLVAELTGYLGTVDLTPSEPEVDGHDAPAEHLVLPTNVPLARGVVWAEAFATDDDAPARLGPAVLRAGSTFRGWDGLTARCSKVARAGLLALRDLRTEAATRELERLYDELELAALVREAGKALGRTEAEMKLRLRRPR